MCIYIYIYVHTYIIYIPIYTYIYIILYLQRLICWTRCVPCRTWPACCSASWTPCRICCVSFA